MTKAKAPLKLVAFEAARYLDEDEAIAEYMTAVLEPRSGGWTRPSGLRWRALARLGAGLPCASLGLNAVGSCPRGEATRPESLPACASAAQFGA